MQYWGLYRKEDLLNKDVLPKCVEDNSILDKIRPGQTIGFCYNGPGIKGNFVETVVSVETNGNRPIIRTNGENRFKNTSFRFNCMSNITIGVWDGNISKQIENARQLVGKKVQFLSGVGMCHGVRVLTRHDEIKGPFWGEIPTDAFERNGNVVVLVYHNQLSHDCYGMANAIQLVSEHKGNEWDEIVVRSYKAERIESQRVWKFGCAHIPFDTILAAQLLCRTHVASGDTRGVEGVQLGAGLFSKDEIGIMARNSI